VKVVLNAFGALGKPGDVVEVDQADAMLAYGAAHRIDDQLEETRACIVELVDGAAELLPAEPVRQAP
jgi:ubiquinone/menaquinone biosynthesis C-methylase UbiE